MVLLNNEKAVASEAENKSNFENIAKMFYELRVSKNLLSFQMNNFISFKSSISNNLTNNEKEVNVEKVDLPSYLPHLLDHLILPTKMILRARAPR